MSNKSYRINTTAGGSDKYIKVKLEQDVDTIEILSLNIKQKDIYSSFNANFGVLIGRVIANGGVGIPNAKVSIFIPISEEDKSNPDISAIYPYETPRDKNIDGVRYNLLPRVAENNPFINEGEYTPNVPVGTFPTKEEITVNSAYAETYMKYYKYTTVTNLSGDYMIYGVPIGSHTVHMSVDITSIGKYSMNPSTMIKNLGYSPNLFIDNGTKIKFTTDLETLPNVETQEVSVDIKPFWGDSENYEIGITRQDFKIRATLVSTFTVFGSAFTDSEDSTWGSDYSGPGDSTDNHSYNMWRIGGDGNHNVSISSKRNGLIDFKIGQINNDISEADAASGNFNPINSVTILDKTQYVQHVDNGEFILLIPCNRRKIITNELGLEVEVDNNNNEGIFTEFRGMFVCSYGTIGDLPISGDFGKTFGSRNRPDRTYFKIPQSAPLNQCLNSDDVGTPNKTYNDNWRKENFKFEYGKIYSVAKFHGLNYRDSNENNYTNSLNRDPFWNTGIIITNNSGDFPDNNSSFDFPSNSGGNGGEFGAEWLNFCLHFPQFSHHVNEGDGHVIICENVTINSQSRFFSENNTQKIFGNLTNTRRFLRNDLHKTSFVEVPKADIINIYNTIQNEKGFTSNDITLKNPTSYPSNGGVKYFYRGIGSADCIKFLIKRNVIKI